MTHTLVCRSCAAQHRPSEAFARCRQCGGELTTSYPEPPRPDPGVTSLWRWRNTLPVGVATEPTSLGEGATPVITLSGPAAHGLAIADVRLKCESMNPTGSFKDRIASVAASLVTERRLNGFVGTSSGNGGAAAAAYAAQGGFPTVLFVLSDVAEAKLDQIRAFGARVVLLEGLGHDAADTERAASLIAAGAERHGYFPMLTGGRFSPEAMDGATTIAYELSEQCPDATVVYVPVGGGGLVSAIGRGYARLREAGVRTPRVVGVQPSGCPTLRRAAEGEPGGLPEATATQISGLQVPVLFDGLGAWQGIRGSGGHLCEVDDDDIREAQLHLAREEGILLEPAGAAAFAGLLADHSRGRLRSDDHAVVIGTGAGYKDSTALRALGNRVAPEVLRRDSHSLESLIADLLASNEVI